MLFTDAGGNLVALNGKNGEYKWFFQLIAIETPSIGDVDGDGELEVVIGSGQDEVYCLDGANVYLHLSQKDGELTVSWSFDKRPVKLYYPVTVRAISGGSVMAEKISTKPPVRLKLGPGEYTIELLYKDQLMAQSKVTIGHPSQEVLTMLAVLAIIAIIITILLIRRRRSARNIEARE